jgi:hypothetical protein
MPDYQLSKIYKLWSPSTNLIYIGSTTQYIAQRLAEHIRIYRRYKNNKGHFLTSFKILECEDYKIELLEEYPCNNREQLFKKEGEYIKSLNCVNKLIMGKTQEEYKKGNKEYYEANKEKNKEEKKEKKKIYREKNKEKIKKWQKEHREKLKEYQKKRYEENQDKLKEYQKEYREKNKKKRKIYYENNKDKLKAYMKEYYEKKKLITDGK